MFLMTGGPFHRGPAESGKLQGVKGLRLMRCGSWRGRGGRECQMGTLEQQVARDAWWVCFNS